MYGEPRKDITGVWWAMSLRQNELVYEGQEMEGDSLLRQIPYINEPNLIEMGGRMQLNIRIVFPYLELSL